MTVQCTNHASPQIPAMVFSVFVCCVCLQAITCQPRVWCVQLTVLYLRSKLQKSSTRRVDRSMRQIEVGRDILVVSLTVMVVSL